MCAMAVVRYVIREYDGNTGQNSVGANSQAIGISCDRNIMCAKNRKDSKIFPTEWVKTNGRHTMVGPEAKYTASYGRLTPFCLPLS